MVVLSLGDADFLGLRDFERKKKKRKRWNADERPITVKKKVLFLEQKRGGR